MPSVLICAQCGHETHDDQSELWDWDGGRLVLICHECAPPDDEE